MRRLKIALLNVKVKLVLAGTISLALLNKVKAVLEKENQSQCHDGIWYSRAGNSWSRSLLLIDRICLLVVVVGLINQNQRNGFFFLSFGRIDLSLYGFLHRTFCTCPIVLGQLSPNGHTNVLVLLLEACINIARLNWRSVYWSSGILAVKRDAANEIF